MSTQVTSETENIVKIKVIGVGGAGNNVINRMVKSPVAGVELIAVNSDKASLSVSNAQNKVRIGEKLTMGQGAGSNPEVGRKAAEESRNNIAKVIEGADMMFIAAGMGGGTGTGAAPVIAELSRSIGALTVGIVTKPFAFEGKKRMTQALAGIQELQTKVDSLLVISNDQLRKISEHNLTLANAFEIADSVLLEAVDCFTDMVTNVGFINIDFADVCSIMKDAGMAHLGVGRGNGKGRALEAARAAISSPLLESSIDGACGVLINIIGPSDIGLIEIEEAATLIKEAAHPTANIILGASFDPQMNDGIKIVVIATRFKPSAVPPTKQQVNSAPWLNKQLSANDLYADADPDPLRVFPPDVPDFIQDPSAVQPPEPPAASSKDDYWDKLMDIFNSR